jgi:hypothetical protein
MLLKMLFIYQTFLGKIKKVLSVNQKLYIMMNQSPEEQRRRIATEAYLRNQVERLGKEAMDKGLITLNGQTPPNYEKPWQIQIHGEDEYFTLEEAKLKLEEMLDTKNS